MQRYQMVSRAIKMHLEEHSIGPFASSDKEDHEEIRFTLYLPGMVCAIPYRIQVYDDAYIVHAISAISADLSHSTISTVTEYIARANDKMRRGSFDFDFDDGMITFRYPVDCDDHIPGMNTIRHSVVIPSAMMQRYLPGLLSAMFGNVEPEEAINLCDDSLVSARKKALDALSRLEEMRKRQEADKKADSDECEGTDDTSGIPSFEDFLENEEEEPESDQD